MPDVVKHAWTHRPRSAGGTDPIPGLPFAYVRMSGSVTCDVGSPARVAVPFHSTWTTPTFRQSGGFSLEADGEIVCPGEGLYDVLVNAFFSDTDWQTKNFTLQTYYLNASQTLAGLLGSQILPGTTLDHSLAHDGTGFFATYDRRKTEMQQVGKLYADGLNAPIRIVPVYHCTTAGETTGWSYFEAFIVKLAELGAA